MRVYRDFNPVGVGAASQPVRVLVHERPRRIDRDARGISDRHHMLVRSNSAATWFHRDERFYYDQVFCSCKRSARAAVCSAGRHAGREQSQSPRHQLLRPDALAQSGSPRLADPRAASADHPRAKTTSVSTGDFISASSCCSGMSIECPRLSVPRAAMRRVCASIIALSSRREASRGMLHHRQGKVS